MVERSTTCISSDWTDFKVGNWQSPFTSAPKTVWSFQRRQFAFHYLLSRGKKGKINA